MCNRRGRLARTFATLRRYRNPFYVIGKRLFGAQSGTITVVDRATRVRCQFPLAALHIFASIWYEHDYDIPRMPIRPGDTVIDVGANYGFFSCYAASKGARVYAFEPSPPVFEQLQKNVAANHFESRITTRPWALSDRLGDAQLLRTDRFGGAMSTIVPEFAKRTEIAVLEKVTVPSHRLSEVIDLFDLSTIRLCKIDAEGSEIAILKGLDQTHRARIQSLAMEFHPEAYHLSELIALLLQWGTHQVSLMDEKPFSGNIVRVVSSNSLLNGEL